MEIRNFIGETFNGGATIELLDMGGSWRVVIEQIEPDEDMGETHMFCFDNNDKKEASVMLAHVVSSDTVYEAEIEGLGFYYL